MSTLIYEPKGRAGEYGSLALNIYRGCGHGCRYCYVPTMKGWAHTREEFHRDPHPRRADIVKQVMREAAKLTADRNQMGMFAQQDQEQLRVFLCFTTDPYQAIERTELLTREIIAALHRYNIAVDVLTKNPMMALRDIDLLDENDSVGATLTFPSTNTLDRIWEPNAPSNKQRMDGLEALARAGLRVWASLEPVILAQASLDVIAEIAPVVQHFKIGALQHAGDIDRQLLHTLPTFDGVAFLNEARVSLDAFGFTRTHQPASIENKTYYIKRSLSYYE